MFVTVGFTDNPDTEAAGQKAVHEAMQGSFRSDLCDFVLMFATSRHDAVVLRQAVSDALVAELGAEAARGIPIIGGASVGVITNDKFGYSGDQAALALVWLEGVQCELLVEGGLTGSEVEVGKKLGQQLLEHGVKSDSPVVLFYDAIDRSAGDVRIAMAVYLLAGLEQRLGFFPNLVGAGLQGDFIASATHQWTGSGIDQHTALALLFSGDIHLDHVIMHGCRPATPYYTVTKSEGQTIFEINNLPALDFLENLFAGTISVDNFPFFLVLGVSSCEKWAEFDENKYASRLCLAINKEQKSIIMFEPDMVAGTEFQIMYRNLSLDYMVPRIESLFSNLEGRKPVFAFYIDCAGRAAGYGGVDLEDALVVQKIVANRVPLLGIYSGVEIGAVEGRPRGLDWTGVFCLFSMPA